MNNKERFEARKTLLEKQFDQLKRPIDGSELVRAFPYSISSTPLVGVIPAKIRLEPKHWGYSHFGVPFRLAENAQETKEHLASLEKPHFFTHTSALLNTLDTSLSQKELLEAGIIVFPSPHYEELVGMQIDAEMSDFDRVLQLAQHRMILNIRHDLPLLTIPTAITLSRNYVRGHQKN